jgi:hypothetical protein
VKVYTLQIKIIAYGRKQLIRGETSNNKLEQVIEGCIRGPVKDKDVN